MTRLSLVDTEPSCRPEEFSAPARVLLPGRSACRRADTAARFRARLAWFALGSLATSALWGAFLLWLGMAGR